MKNIWIINHYAIPPSLGGLTRHYYFKKELEQRDLSVRIFSASQIHNSSVNMIPEKKIFCKNVSVDGEEYTFIKTGGYRGNGLSRIKNLFEFALKIRKIPKYASDSPDVIYTSSPDLFTAYAAQKLAKKLKVPCIVEIRDLWPLSIVEYKNISPRRLSIKILYRLERKIYERANAIVFTMPGGNEYIKDRKWETRVDLNKVYYVSNGVDLAQQTKLMQENSVDDADLESNAFKVVYAGSIREVNDIGKLVDVAKATAILRKDVQFLFYGDGNQKEHLEARCKREYIENVKFKGRVEKKFIPYICSKANVNIINVKPTGVSKYGVSWNKLFDYMAAGRPILSTTAVNYDYIAKYNCGITTENQNIETIVDALIRLYELSPEDYRTICENSLRAAQDFDYAKLADDLKCIIETILA